jgi:hypothetical protein
VDSIVDEIWAAEFFVDEIIGRNFASETGELCFISRIILGGSIGAITELGFGCVTKCFGGAWYKTVTSGIVYCFCMICSGREWVWQMVRFGCFKGLRIFAPDGEIYNDFFGEYCAVSPSILDIIGTDGLTTRMKIGCTK